MKEKVTNIHPIFEDLVPREIKEELIGQKSKVFWFTGLSGSGKSTIAMAVEKELIKQGFLVQVLDGDNIRSGINNNLGFSADDRAENIRRIAEVAKLFVHTGVITLNCFVSPTKDIRGLAKSIIGDSDFSEIYINAPYQVCEQRDVKGLYKKARQGEIKNFTGLDAPFEAPDDPDLEIKTDQLSEAESVDKVLNYILPIIKYNK